MKAKFALSLFLAAASLTAWAQGQKDAIEYFECGKMEEAKILFERTFNDADANKSKAKYYLGAIALATENDAAKAKALFDEGIALDPKEGLNYVGLGSIALKNGNAAAAEDHFKQAGDADSKDAEVQAAIAREYFNADPVAYAKQIEKYLKKAKKADKDNPAAYVLEGDMLTAQKKWGEAAGYYEMAIQFDNDDAQEAYVKYADTYFNINPDEAIRKLQELLRVVPNSALAQHEIAEKYYDNHQIPEATAAYGEYIKNPNHFAKDEERYVFLLFADDKFQQAYDESQRLLRINPQSFLMKRLAFRSKAALKEWQAAADLGAAFMQATPDKNNKFVVSDYTNYGEVLSELGRYDDAIVAYENALKVAPDKVEIYKDLSNAYMGKEDYQASLAAYKSYIDMAEKPSTNDKYTLAGRYLNMVVSKQDPDGTYFRNGVEIMNEVCNLVPDDYRVFQRRAQLYLAADEESKTGIGVDACKELIRVLDLKPENKTEHASSYIQAYVYLATYYYNSGDIASAKEYYTRWLDVDPTNDALRNYVNSLK